MGGHCIQGQVGIFTFLRGRSLVSLSTFLPSCDAAKGSLARMLMPCCTNLLATRIVSQIHLFIYKVPSLRFFRENRQRCQVVLTLQVPFLHLLHILFCESVLIPISFLPILFFLVSFPSYHKLWAYQWHAILSNLGG